MAMAANSRSQAHQDWTGKGFLQLHPRQVLFSFALFVSEWKNISAGISCLLFCLLRLSLWHFQKQRSELLAGDESVHPDAGWRQKQLGPVGDRAF